MTLVLGLVAKESVVLAADGQATGGKGEFLTRTPARKITTLHGRLAFGCAGGAGLRQRVVERLEHDIPTEICGQPIAELRPKLLAAVNRVQHDASSEYVKAHYLDEPDGIAVLFAGVSDENEPWLYEITAKGIDEVHRRAEAIGSGRHYARYALVSAEHYELTSRGVGPVRTLAYRALDTAIRTDATALGEPIMMYEVTRDGAREVLEDEIDAIKTAIQGLQEHERAVFDQTHVPPTTEEHEVLPAVELKGIDPVAETQGPT